MRLRKPDGSAGEQEGLGPGSRCCSGADRSLWSSVQSHWRPGHPHSRSHPAGKQNIFQYFPMFSHLELGAGVELSGLVHGLQSLPTAVSFIEGEGRTKDIFRNNWCFDVGLTWVCHECPGPPAGRSCLPGWPGSGCRGGWGSPLPQSRIRQREPQADLRHPPCLQSPWTCPLRTRRRLRNSCNEGFRRELSATARGSIEVRDQFIMLPLSPVLGNSSSSSPFNTWFLSHRDKGKGKKYPQYWGIRELA